MYQFAHDFLYDTPTFVLSMLSCAAVGIIILSAAILTRKP
jgi:hypothetical protein